MSVLCCLLKPIRTMHRSNAEPIGVALHVGWAACDVPLLRPQGGNWVLWRWLVYKLCCRRLDTWICYDIIRDQSQVISGLCADHLLWS